MSEAEKEAENLKFLDDLHVEERFVSTSHILDAGQIKAFASQFDPQQSDCGRDIRASGGGW